MGVNAIDIAPRANRIYILIRMQIKLHFLSIAETRFKLFRLLLLKEKKIVL